MATVAPPPAASPLPAPDSGGGEEAWGESEADAQWVVVDETMGDTSNGRYVFCYIVIVPVQIDSLI